MEKAKKIARLFLGVPATIISFAFIFKVFFDNREIVADSFTKIDLLSFFTGVFFFAIFFLIKSFVWILILKARGNDIVLQKTLLKYSIAELKRYIPGSIFAFAGRVESHQNIHSKETIKGIGIEILLLILSAFLISLPSLSYIFPFLNNLLIFSTIIFLLIIIFYFKKVLIKFIDIFFLLSLAWIFYGIGCLFVANSVTNIMTLPLIPLLSFFVGSWLLGYLFFIAPMGLGVREVVIIFALSIFIPKPIAASIAILSRIAMTVGEILNLIIVASIKNIEFKKIESEKSLYLFIVILFSFVYFIVFTYLSLLKHDKLLSGRFDLGNMSQTVWNTSQGRFFMLTNPDGEEIVSRLAVHSDFILVLFTPFYWIWSSPKILLIFQSLFMSIGGIFIYLIAKKLLDSYKLAFILSISYFLNFWLHEQNLFDFHAVTLATPLLLASFYFLLQKKYILFILSLFFATLTKENVFLTASFFGLYFFLFENKKKIGIAFFITCLAIFYFLSSVAIPGARGEAHFVLSNYDYLGNSLLDVIKNSILKPQVLISQLFNFSTISYLYYHLLPVGFLPIVAPFYLIFTLPEMAIYLLAKNYEYRSYQYHFGAIFIPFIYISTIYSIKVLIKKFKRFNIEKITIYYLAFFSTVSVFYFSPLPGMHGQDKRIFQSSNSSQILNYLKLIPIDASVAASNNIAAHLSHRQKIYVVPYGMTIADFIIFYNEKNEIMNMIDNVHYELWLLKDGLLMYKKKLVIPCAKCKP